MPDGIDYNHNIAHRGAPDDPAMSGAIPSRETVNIGTATEKESGDKAGIKIEVRRLIWHVSCLSYKIILIAMSGS